MNVNNSVVYTASEDDKGGLRAEIVTQLLGLGLTRIGGGGAGLFGLSPKGVYSSSSSEPLSGICLDEVAVGGQCVVAIGSDSEIEAKKVLYSWGIGDLGELGLGPSTTFIDVPKRIKYEGSFTQISSGATHSVALDDRGNVYAWGQNFDKQLGLYTKKISDMQSIRELSQTEDVLFSPRFIPISLQKPIMKVSCGDSFTAVVTRTGEVWTWGSGQCGQLGTGRCTYRELPVEVKLNKMIKQGHSAHDKVTVFSKVKDLCCGSAHVIVVVDDGEALGWGLNKFGQLGTGDTETKFSATSILFDMQIKQIYAYGNCSAAIDEHRYLYTWGSSYAHRLMRNGGAKSHEEVVMFHQARRNDFEAMRLQTFVPSDKAHPNNHESVDDPLVGTNTIQNDHVVAQPLKFGGMAVTSGGIKSLRALSENPDTSVDCEGLVTSNMKNNVNYFAIPEMVTLFQEQRISSFTFSRACSAVLVVSKVDALSPALGPTKNFSRLVLHGEGLWESGTIVIRFTPLDGEGPVRSTPGRLMSPREVECCPPKLPEAGMYSVEVAMDGKSFLPQSLPIRIYKEVPIDKIGPSLVDLRSVAESKITVSVKNLKVYEDGELDHEENPLWPYKSDLDDGKLSIKLYLTCSRPGSQSASTSEVVLPAELVPLPIIEYDTALSGSKDVKIAEQSSVVSETNSATGAYATEGDSVSLRGESSAVASMTNTSVSEREVSCKVDFTSLVEPGSLIMIRAALSINGQDFGAPSSESNPTICHSFSPMSSVPSCRPLQARFHGKASASDSQSSLQPCSRIVTIHGQSFIPVDKLPPGLRIEGVIRATIPSGEESTTSKSKKSKHVQVEKTVDIECTAADKLSLYVPTLDELLSPGSTVTVSSHLPNGNTKQGRSLVGEVSLNIFFRLVNTSLSPAPSKSRSPSKRGSSSNARSGGGTSAKKATKQGEEDIPLLSPIPVKVILYTSQALSVEPRLARRFGGKGTYVVLQGKGNGGFPFKTHDLKVVLFRHDLDLSLEIPRESIHMIPSDVKVSSSGVPNNAIGVDSRADGEDSLEWGIPHKILIKPLPRLFLPEVIDSEDITAAEEDRKELISPCDGDPVSESDSIVERTGEIGESVAGNNSEPQAEERLQVEATERQGDLTEPAHDRWREQEATIQALDFVFVKVLLDGESSVDDPEHISHVQLLNAPLPLQVAEVPKGGASAGASIRISIPDKCVPSDQCVVRLRDANDVSLECPAEVTTDTPTASPESVIQYFEEQRLLKESVTEVGEHGDGDGHEGNRGESNCGGKEDEEASTGNADAVESRSHEESLSDVVIGLLDTGGVEGSVIFDCPDITSMEPVIFGKEKFLFIDVSLDGGATFDSTDKPILNVK